MSSTPTRVTPRPATAERGVGRRQSDLSLEQDCMSAGARLVGGMDEVGRGALAGPVTVGITVVSAQTEPVPTGLTDSKLLSPAARERFEGIATSWVLAWGVGHSSPAEIDEIGIIGALRRAGLRALTQAQRTCGPIDALLLDGSHNWLADPDANSLFADGGSGHAPGHARTGVSGLDSIGDLPVRMVVKGDETCASISAASVLAKCARDRIMSDLALDAPAYGWAGNKGYGAPAHLAALREHGPSDQHRLSWKLPERVPGAIPGSR